MSNYILELGAPESCDPSRVGPKAANQAALKRAGFPVPRGFCLTADAYRAQVRALGLEHSARGAFASDDRAQARRYALDMRLGLLDKPLALEILEPLLAARRRLADETGALLVVRSSALVEDREGASFAGQFESFLGLEDEQEFVTAVRACWGALWATRALRYMASHELDPADTAMAVLVQPLIRADAAGGGMSLIADGGMLLSATWGLGSSIAQGEVTPDRYQLSAAGEVLEIVAGRKDHSVGCVHRAEPMAHLVPKALMTTPCLDHARAAEIGRMMKAVAELMNMPVEIEWALDHEGFKLLQARPLHMRPAQQTDPAWLHHPRLNGHPAGIGWSEGRAVVVNCECELARVAPGDILVTKVAGPALSQVLPRVAGLVSELGGSTSHLASLARERGIPMVLGVHEATQRIPDGARMAVDGVAGVVRWMGQAG
jgi:pyruvate,water dikinase